MKVKEMDILTHNPEKPLVDFLVAGVARGGTTTIYNALKNHSSISMSFDKEPHYFDDESVDWSAPNHKRDYTRFFKKTSEKVIYGEATPIYFYWPQSAFRIFQYNPNIKIIVTLRDRVARTFSHWKYNTIIKWENMSFSDAIRFGRARLKNTKVGDQKLFSYIERSLYSHQMARWHSLFPKEQILYLQFSDLQNYSEIVLQKITDFLQVPSFPKDTNLLELNSSRKADPHRLQHSDYVHLRQIFSDDEYEALEYFEVICQEKIHIL